MATSQIPTLIDALVALAQSVEIPSLTVYDGTGSIANPGDFIMIGVDDPDAPDSSNAADSQQQWAATTGGAIDETGKVTCAALSWNGNGDQKAARDAAFATCNALATALRSNPTLGLAQLLWVRYGADQALSQDQTDAAAQALVIFSVYFRARF